MVERATSFDQAADGFSAPTGWLGWRVETGELVQVGALRPKGVPGFLYWKVLQPIHRKVFAAQARHRVTRVLSLIHISSPVSYTHLTLPTTPYV